MKKNITEAAKKKKKKDLLSGKTIKSIVLDNEKEVKMKSTKKNTKLRLERDG